MKKIHLTATFVFLTANLASAQACPAPPDIEAPLSALIADARAATSEMEARPISNRMWALWADAPDDAAQEILDRGIRRREAQDFLGALNDFERLVEYCPDYAEGYNQRAFINFILGNYDAALVDLDKAIARSPRHVAAIAGKALTLMGLNRNGEAAVVLRKALALNPWLSERHFLDQMEQVEDEI